MPQLTREPTEAEKRAIAEAYKAILARHGSGLGLLRDGGYVNVDGPVNLHEVVRAVIRSLREPTAEMVKAYDAADNAAGWDNGPDAEGACAALIDAASPADRTPQT